MISDINIFVDRDRCFACGICVDRCILDNLRLHLAPCRTACPLHMNCQGYIRLIAQGKEREAAQEMRNYLPFGSILGRTCHYPCESRCEQKNRGDGAVHIRALKRYLADNYAEIATAAPTVANETGKTVAIVGSGPSGLMAAHDLRAQGHAVTVFEAASAPGGLLRWGIPSFRLPVGEIEAAIKMLETIGIVFKTGEALGNQFELADLEHRFDAILLALGASAPVALGIPGEEMESVYQGLDILKQAKQDNPPNLGSSVIVVGGGNCAVDSALTLSKLGVPEIRMVCLEDSGEMPAFETELQEVREEGIIIENCKGPRRFVRMQNGKIGVELSTCVSVFDEQGNFCPQLEDACSLGFEADAIVVAIGQELKRDGIPQALIGNEDRLTIDPITLQSPENSKIFCCGDAVSGTGSVVAAMAQGREAAISIDRYVKGDGLEWGRDMWLDSGFLEDYEVDPKRVNDTPRAGLIRTPVAKRDISTETEAVLTSAAAKKEAARCLSCGRAAEVNQTCWFCLPCEIECPVDALEVKLPYLVR